MGQKDELDRFYTSTDVVDACLERLSRLGVSCDDYQIIVEPSAGAGAFSSPLPERAFAFDLSPAPVPLAGGPEIEARDWFDVSHADLDLVDDGEDDGFRFLVIGNPPFGLRSSLAKKFIEHAVELGATTVAFVLPDIFSKMSNQKCFPSGWRLADILPLRREAFELDGEPYHVPCSFFVWTCENGVMPGADLREYPVPAPDEFSYLKRGDASAHFSLNGNSGRVKEISEITNPKAEHYIRVSDGYDVEEVKGKLRALDFDFKSSANGGVAWVNRDDINRAWQAKYGKMG